MLYRIFETSTMEARSDFQWAPPPELFSKGKPITHANSVNFLTLVESVTNCQAPRRYVASYRLNGDLLHCLSGRRSLMATRLLSAAAGGGKTAQGCALCPHAQTACRGLQRRTAPAAVNYIACFSPRRCCCSRGRGIAEVVLLK